MGIAKQKIKVNIYLKDNLMINGFVYMNPGERLQDFINNSRRFFIPVNTVNLCYIEQISFKPNTVTTKDNVILNKSSILWIEESV